MVNPHCPPQKKEPPNEIQNIFFLKQGEIDIIKFKKIDENSHFWGDGRQI